MRRHTRAPRLLQCRVSTMCGRGCAPSPVPRAPQLAPGAAAAPAAPAGAPAGACGPACVSTRRCRRCVMSSYLEQPGAAFCESALPLDGRAACRRAHTHGTQLICIVCSFNKTRLMRVPGTCKGAVRQMLLRVHFDPDLVAGAGAGAGAGARAGAAARGSSRRRSAGRGARGAGLGAGTGACAAARLSVPYP